MREILQEDIDTDERLVNRALNFLRYLKDIKEEAAAEGFRLADGSWHDVPRGAFDAAGGVDSKVTEWRRREEDGKTYWTKDVRGFTLFTREPPNDRSRPLAEVVVTVGGVVLHSAAPDLCADCGEPRWRLAGDEAGGSPLVKACERCGKERPL